MIVRCRQPTRRTDGSYVRFDSNAIGVDRQRKESARHAHLRRRRPRAARPQFHENRQPRERGGVMHMRVDDTVEVIYRRRPRRREQGAEVDHRRRQGRSSKASTASTNTSAAASATRRAGGCRKRCRSQLSNVMLVCPSCGKPTRTGARRESTAARSGTARSAVPAIGMIAPRAGKGEAAEEVSLRETRNECMSRPRKEKAMAEQATPRPSSRRGPPPTPRLLERYQQGCAARLGREAGPHQSACRCRDCKRSWSTWASGRRSPRRNTWKTPLPR